jgi:transposase
MKYMGIDLHKQYFVATVMDEGGLVVSKDRVSTDRAAIREYFGRVVEDDAVEAVLEAGYSWGYFYDEIAGLVDGVKLAHPLKTRAIAEARIKTDSLDSEVLAHLLRADLVAEAYAPPFETRDRKNLIRHRSALVKLKSALKNMVHAVLDRNHIEDPEFRQLSDKFGKRGRALMKEFRLKGADTRMLRNYLSVIDKLEQRIAAVEKEIRKTFRKDEVCKLLRSVPGIGELSAVLIRYEIDDIERFASAGKLCSYAGLVPSTYSSGGRTFQGRITKQGSKTLRWILVEAAQRAVRKDAWLRNYHRKVKSRGGGRKATVAVARKLLEIIYTIWKENRPYYEKSVAVALYSV